MTHETYTQPVKLDNQALRAKLAFHIQHATTDIANAESEGSEVPAAEVELLKRVLAALVKRLGSVGK